MITTNDENLACFARSVRNHGIDKDRFVRLGYNWRLTEIQAILGIHQLLRIEEFIRKRNEIVSIYKNFLLGVKELTFINVPLSLRHSYYKFPVIFSDGINTVDFSKRIYQGYGISLTPLYYPPIHLQPYYITLGYKEGMLPVSERILKQELCLPVYPELTEEEIKNIASAIKETLKSDRKI
jgi:dTDP-4-amino-4,6-dideoxygalactose transaminase